MGVPQKLVNPLALAAFAVLAVTRGGLYVVSGLAGGRGSGVSIGPVIPPNFLVMVGVLWALSGVFLAVSLWRWRWIQRAGVVMTALYGAWAVIHAVVVVLVYDWESVVDVVAMVTYGIMVLTLVNAEVDRRPVLSPVVKGEAD